MRILSPIIALINSQAWSSRLCQSIPTKDSRVLIKEEDHELHFEVIKTDDSDGILHHSSKKVKQQQVSMHVCMPLGSVCV